jgi:hypothetical protein
VKRASRWERSPGWIRSGIGTAVLVGGFFVVVGLPVGYVLAHVSDLIGTVFGGRQ